VIHTPFVPTLQPAFQPGSTPVHLMHRFMVGVSSELSNVLLYTVIKHSMKRVLETAKTKNLKNSCPNYLSFLNQEVHCSPRPPLAWKKSGILSLESFHNFLVTVSDSNYGTLTKIFKCDFQLKERFGLTIVSFSEFVARRLSNFPSQDYVNSLFVLPACSNFH